MLVSSPFYNESITKYTALFGTLFNNIHIEKRVGNIYQKIKVPISYASKDKLFERVKEDPDLDRPQKISLPRMGFVISNVAYDNNRKIQTVQRIRTPNSLSYVPVPYNISFTLSILAGTQTEGLRIVEQILPFFTPDWTPRIELIPDHFTTDVPIVLQSVNSEDTFEGSFDDGRMIVWNLEFEMRGWLFGPVKTGNNVTGVIKFTTVNLHDSLTSNTPSESVSVQPGLTANGEPTSNVSNSVAWQTINADDNYGYIITYTP